MMRDPAFYEQPLCAETDPELFFPPIGIIPSDAKKTCRVCDHITECVTWALHHQVDGVWGATTPRERNELRKQLGIKAKAFYKSGILIRPINLDEDDNHGI